MNQFTRKFRDLEATPFEFKLKEYTLKPHTNCNEEAEHRLRTISLTRDRTIKKIKSLDVDLEKALTGSAEIGLYVSLPKVISPVLCCAHSG